MWSHQARQLVEMACDEDLGTAGDLTSILLRDGTADVAGRVVPREPGIICGLAVGPIVSDVFSRRLQHPATFTAEQRDGGAVQDGDAVETGDAVAMFRGAQVVVLGAERTLLNFLGRMSGVATLTHRFVTAARAVSADVTILDTRKTIPGWRMLDKYAVRAGGGQNHRMGLHDAVLIKDNHLAGVPAGGLTDALAALLEQLTGEPRFVEVEVDNLKQLTDVCRVPGVDIVLLDNFAPEQLRSAVDIRDDQGLRGKLALEASGGITLHNVAQIAATGIDRISVGALTHSAPCLDIGLDL